MAKGRSGVGGGTAALPPPSDRDLIIDAAFARIAQDGWRRLSMAGIAAEAGISILRVYRAFPSKPAILSGFFRRIDEAVLAAPIEAEADERPRDRVFDLMMRRFDALAPYKPALEILGRELPTDPCVALAAGARMLRSMRWMLEAAGTPTGGIGGIIAVKLTAAAYMASLRVWLRDDSPDLAPTMAALDRRLRSIERWLGAQRQGSGGSAGATA
jgi:AcrR family transcriptional regulator